MVSSSPRYLVGIDLGTTNSVVAYADLNGPLNSKSICLFEIEQLVGPGEVAKRQQLPSFRYHPAPEEISKNDISLPWQNSSHLLTGEINNVIIGEWARELGSKTEGRLVNSAKSWLSHDKVDRMAPILPWGSASEVEKVSPIQASASYLNYIRNAWDHEFPQAPLAKQKIVITIPASFDEIARNLTVEAAKQAGLETISLLEEPQAVCYDWYLRQGSKAAESIAKFNLLLVCDLGGGTSDFSLIRVKRDKNNELQLERIGVGEHLMLGGDNVDYSLAHIAEQRINGSGSKKLSVASLSQLNQQTRKIKEQFLSSEAPDKLKVTLLGSGSKLIGGSRSCEFTQEEVSKLALDGFFPLVENNDFPVKRKTGLVSLGLPYVSDPAISKHIAKFLSDHQIASKEALSKDQSDSNFASPDALLVNGGVFNSQLIYERCKLLLEKWGDKPVVSLENNTPDLSVAYGAVAYSISKETGAKTIGGGSPRSYFLELEQKEDGSDLICLLPKYSETDAALSLDKQFKLTVGQPVKFNIVSSTSDHTATLGQALNLSNQELEKLNFHSLPPLIISLESDTNQSNEITVNLVSKMTEVGTLEILCVAETGEKWKLEFDIRINSTEESTPTIKNTSLNPNFTKVEELVTLVFGVNQKNVNPKAIKSLRIDIEKQLGKRDQWELPELRALFDLLIKNQKQRRRSAAHERVWLNLAGFTLRPGFGYPADDWRIQQVWKIYQQGVLFEKEKQNWIDWWNLWRRAAGGLAPEQQLKIYNDIKKYINISSLSSRKLQAEVQQKSYEEIVKLLASLENIPPEEKQLCGDWLLKRLKKSSETITSWWVLGRLGSRTFFHGSAHNVVANSTVQNWLPTLLSHDWKKNPHIAFAAVLLSRKSGDRTIDIEPSFTDKVITKLTKDKQPSAWIEIVKDVKTLDEAQTKRVFGEGLPPGLTLID